MKSLTTPLFLLLALVLAGCASPGARFSGPVPAPDGKALLYVFFQHGAFMRKPSQDVYINGEKVVKIEPGSFYIYAAKPGVVVISDHQDPGTEAEQAVAAKEKTTLKVAVEEGGVYFVEWVYVMGVPTGTRYFRAAKPANALYAISDCFQLEGEKPAGSRLAGAAPPPAMAPQTIAGTAPRPSEGSMGGATAVATPPAPVPTPPEVERPNYDSLLTVECEIHTDSNEEKIALGELVAFLKEQKENRDFDQIAKIEFGSATTAKVVFTWFGGKHLGTLTLVKEMGAWKITKESHSI